MQFRSVGNDCAELLCCAQAPMAPRVRQDKNDILPPPRKESVPSSVMRGLKELDDDDEGDDGGFDIPDALAIK